MDRDQLVAFLNQGAGGPVPADKLIETHAAQIFLIGEHAYKIKKPVNLGYLDFSTLRKRKLALERELERNTKMAPGLYLKVAEVRRDSSGNIHFNGCGKIIDYVLVMRRFPNNALLSDNVDLVHGDFAEELGRSIARVHAVAAVVSNAWPAGLEYALKTNSNRLLKFKSVLGGEDVERLIEESQTTFHLQRGLIKRREKAGFIRRCHGDLHLKNIFLQEGHPVLFDCIEFDDRLSDIDVLYDLAFLVMDLLHHDKKEGANRLVSAYFDESLRSVGGMLLDGLALMPLFLSMRAAVRAHVSAQMKQPIEGRSYLHGSLEYLRNTKPSLISIGGLSGTGKTYFARKRAPSAGSAPGAMVLRSDEIRKRLWNVGPLERLPPEAYAPKESRRVYDAMFDEARTLLRAGCSVVLDAVFLKPSERERCARLAEEVGVKFEGIWLEAPVRLLRERISSRSGDASDADLSVLEGQLKHDAGKISWERVDASQ